jgi:hypothetical protein
MTAKFEVGDIVTLDPTIYVDSNYEEGEVTEVEEDGYVSVRLTNSDMVFAYWPKELVQTGRKLDPSVVPILQNLDKAIEEAQSTIWKLKSLRAGVVALGLDKGNTTHLG